MDEQGVDRHKGNHQSQAEPCSRQSLAYCMARRLA